jgi:hypothetical protein
MSEDVKPYGAANRPEDPKPEELRALVEQTGMSLRKAAEELDISVRSIRYYASGEQPIPRVVIYALRYLVSQEHSRANALVDLQVGEGRTSSRTMP